MTLPDPVRARRIRRDALRRMGARLRASWAYAAPGFEAGRDYLSARREAIHAEPPIWRNRANRVWKVVLPPEAGGETVVYKHIRGARAWRYVLAPTVAAREAANYAVFEAFGFPMATLLAVEEVRANFRWRESRIVTRFLDGYRDGRAFAPEGVFPEVEPDGSAARRRSFLTQAMPLLARVHALYLFHKGFKPYNILWKPAEAEGGVELRLIDFGSCRFRPRIGFGRYVVHDLADLFRTLRPTPEELAEYVAHYRAHAPADFPDERILVRRVAQRVRAGHASSHA